MRALLAVCTVALIAGCSGKVDYVRPSAPPVASNSKPIEKPRDAIWNAGVPELGKQFFVINNLDKSSGLINVSYTGDPENYIDCGRVISHVKNMRGERTYDFPGARAQQIYEVMYSGRLFYIERKISLEGWVNLVFEDISQGYNQGDCQYTLCRYSARYTARGVKQYPSIMDRHHILQLWR